MSSPRSHEAFEQRSLMKPRLEAAINTRALLFTGEVAGSAGFVGNTPGSL